MPRLLFAVVGVIAIAATGCKKEETAEVSQSLEQSFQQAEPQVQQVIHTLATSLRTKNYTEATRALAPAITGRPLTEQQKQAVTAALVQINQAIEADPSLDTKEMYDLRARIFHAVHGRD